MKKIFILLLPAVLISSILFGQNVAINQDGSDPDASAMLDVKSSNKGILVPRLSMSQRLSISTPAAGLLVYQTDAIKGFYYNNGDAATPVWSLLQPAGVSWLMNGNAGTNPTINFIGTTNNQPLVLKSNNELVARLQSGTDANVSLGFWAGLQNTGSNNIAIGSRALLVNTTGNQNVAIGSASMFTNKEGRQNTAIGFSTLYYNYNGTGNAALGINSLVNNINGNSNTASGASSLFRNTNGHLNTAIGSNALYNNLTGIQNTAIGSSADVLSDNLNNATAIGANARVDCNNCLVLGSVNGVNNATSNVTVGIGTSNPEPTAALEMASTSKGLLIPRMTEAERLAIPNPAIGLLVYQKNGEMGFYYNNGTASTPSWVNVLSQNSGWSLAGNRGGGVLGTLDGSPLNFIVNGSLAGFLHPTNTRTSFGYLADNTGAPDNVAFGYKAIVNNEEGGSNVAIGNKAQIELAAGSSNVSVGNNTMKSLSIGSSNTALGDNADVSNRRNNATAVGASSKVECDGCLVLGSVSTSDASASVRTGIGTTNPNPSAALEISSDKRGLLIPRMTEAERNAIVNPAKGLLVFQFDGEMGFYYNNGTASSSEWVNILSQKSGWSRAGNTGSGVLGTLDPSPLRLIVHGSQAGFVDVSNTNTSLGYLANNTGAPDNVAVGYRALTANEDGGSNVAIGNKAQFELATGSSNVSVGNNTMKSLSMGHSNTALGDNADVSNQRNNATAVGASSKVECDGCLVLGSVSTSDASASVRTGIGTTNPNPSAALEISSDKRGLLIPRMTQTQRDAISSPANGLLVYQIDNTPGFYYYNSTSWQSLPAPTLLDIDGDGITDQFDLEVTTAGCPVTSHGVRLDTDGDGVPDCNDKENITPTTCQPVDADGVGKCPVSGWSLGGNNISTSSESPVIGTRNGPLEFIVNGKFAGKIDHLNQSTSFGIDANVGGVGQNVAFGIDALRSNEDGGSNVAIGNKAQLALQLGSSNVSVGNNTLKTLTLGSQNTAIGDNADLNTGRLNNATAIGSGAIVNASNTVQIGNSFVTDVYFGNPASTLLHANSVTPSDARFKYDVKANVPGLDFINKLKPVTYYFDEQKLDEFSRSGIIGNTLIKPASFNIDKQLHTGFLAQDVEKIANQLGYKFDGVHKPINDKDHYSLAYSQFIMPLVKSVQEQQLQIDELKKENKELKKVKDELDALKKLVEKLYTNK